MESPYRLSRSRAMVVSAHRSLGIPIASRRLMSIEDICRSAGFASCARSISSLQPLTYIRRSCQYQSGYGGGRGYCKSLCSVLRRINPPHSPSPHQQNYTPPAELWCLDPTTFGLDSHSVQMASRKATTATCPFSRTSLSKRMHRIP